MAAGKKPTLEEGFIARICNDRVAVTVFLVNGVKLQGIVTMFDDDTLLLQRDDHIQLVYKHAISTIMPTASIAFYSDQ